MKLEDKQKIVYQASKEASEILLKGFKRAGLHTVLKTKVLDETGDTYTVMLIKDNGTNE